MLQTKMYVARRVRGAHVRETHHYVPWQYFDRVYQFAFSAVDRIASAPKPSLIILQNKCGQSSQLNVDVRGSLNPPPHCFCIREPSPAERSNGDL
jgi:hypothetical protein